MLDSHDEVRASDSAAPLFASSIRVVSPALDSADPAAHWNADLGQPLRVVSESLLAEALRLALLFADGGIAPSQTMSPKSLRFMQGGTERVERAELLLQDCSRTVLRTLRGTLMSVPTHRPDGKCPTSAASTLGTSPSN